MAFEKTGREGLGDNAQPDPEPVEQPDTEPLDDQDD